MQLVASLCSYSGGLGAPKSEKVSFFRLSPPETRSIRAIGAKLIASLGADDGDPQVFGLGSLVIHADGQLFGSQCSGAQLS